MSKMGRAVQDMQEKVANGAALKDIQKEYGQLIDESLYDEYALDNSYEPCYDGCELSELGELLVD